MKGVCLKPSTYKNHYTKSISLRINAILFRITIRESTMLKCKLVDKTENEFQSDDAINPQYK